MSGAAEYKVVMTPRKTGNVTTIQVERVTAVDQSKVFHEGAGQHQGLVINKDTGPANGSMDVPEMQLEFTCLMCNRKTGDTHAENRRLKFWFIEGIQQFHKLDSSYAFFKELVNPDTFPRDYVSFIKKIMKQMQVGQYTNLRRVDADLITLDKKEQEALVPELNLSAKEERPVELIVREALQMRLEEAYPNVLSMDDLVRILEVDKAMIDLQIKELQARDILQEVEMGGKSSGQRGFRRHIVHVNEEVKVMQSQNHFQQVSNSEKPTIAIITNLLCEKLAVDAMMEHKITFVRYKTEGDSHVYTIGVIGKHKVISVKLPMVGGEREAKISSGNTTTRLLGAFQEVQHVLMVGVAGSVPHVYEFERHSRLGDIVVGTSADNEQPLPMYIYCEDVVVPSADAPANTPIRFKLKKYPSSPSRGLLDCVDRVLDGYELAPENCEWQRYIEDGLKSLAVQETHFSRPPPDTDKLKFKVSETYTFDIKHPEVPPMLAHLYREGVPAVRLGSMGSGRAIIDNDALRDTFAKEHHILAYDAEYDQVLESIMGNRLSSYLFIRGMADYHNDGRTGAVWQPYAALAAAAFLKAVLLQLH